MVMAILGVLLIYTCYVCVHIWFFAKASRPLVDSARPYELKDSSLKRTMLVLGDSTAVGVGTSPDFSLAGLMSAYFSTSVENYAQSGAITEDLGGQVYQAENQHYDLILIQIGANDIIHFRSLTAAAFELEQMLPILKRRSDRILLLTAGDVGNAKIFPWPLNLIISARTRDLRERFIAVAKKENVVYVDIYARPDIFSSDPKRYYAPDMLHLSADGYGYWFSIVKEYVEKNWPEFATNK